VENDSVAVHKAIAQIDLLALEYELHFHLQFSESVSKLCD
jgi:hypothetical protein